MNLKRTSRSKSSDASNGSWEVSCSVRTSSPAMNRRGRGRGREARTTAPSSAPRIPHSALGRFMGSSVFRSDLLTAHEPASRWDRRHPCRRIACGLPRRQGCRRSQVHGKFRVPFGPAHWPMNRRGRGTTTRTRTRSEDNCPQFRTPHSALRTRKVHGKVPCVPQMRTAMNACSAHTRASPSPACGAVAMRRPALRAPSPPVGPVGERDGEGSRKVQCFHRTRWTWLNHASIWVGCLAQLLLRPMRG